MQMWCDAGVLLCSRPWTTLYARFRANSATNMACSRLAQMGCSEVTRHALGTVVVMQTKFSSTSERNCSLIAGGTAFTSNTLHFAMHPSPRQHAFSLEVHSTEQSTAFVACLTSQANCPVKKRLLQAWARVPAQAPITDRKQHALQHQLALASHFFLLPAGLLTASYASTLFSPSVAACMHACTRLPLPKHLFMHGRKRGCCDLPH